MTDIYADSTTTQSHEWEQREPKERQKKYVLVPGQSRCCGASLRMVRDIGIPICSTCERPDPDPSEPTAST